MYTAEQRLKDIKCAIADLVGDKTQPTEEVVEALWEIMEECENWLSNIPKPITIAGADIKDGETVCEHGYRPFECDLC